MLFPYVYLPDHSIYKLQSWVDQIFLDVWCKAEPTLEYSVDLLPPEIKEITLEIYNNDRIDKDYFYGPIERVYKIFQSFDQQIKDSLVKCYRDNNAIEDLCKGKLGCNTFLYSELDGLNSLLKKEIEDFYRNLFNSVIHLESVQKRIGTINEHYKDFVKINNKGVCPICGLITIDNEFNQTREAYDHYLPKSKYPFNSINFTNLAPICHKCNSSNKGASDPLHSKNGKRRKAFFIYSTEQHNVEISISLKNTQNKSDLKPQNVDIKFGPDILSEELNTWDDLFRIKRRYKAVCCGSDGKYWITQIADECKNYGLTPDTFLRVKLKEAEQNPYFDYNFLRKPFLEACETKHVFG